MAIHLVRHAKAGSRSAWKGPDDARPLSKAGRRQAARLVEVLCDRGAVRVCSSPSLRCVQTVEPSAEKLGLAVEPAPELAEGTTRADVSSFLGGLLPDALDADRSVVLSTHGDVIPIILEVVADEHGFKVPPDGPCAKGSVWELVVGRKGRRTTRYLPPPG